MISTIVPAGVAVCETREAIPEALLLPGEEAGVRHASEARRREYTTGRECAHRALAQLGIASAVVPAGPNRQPQWPPGIVGSITHCAGYWAGVAARKSAVATIGIDAEIHDELPRGVFDTIALEQEKRWVLAHEGMGIHWDRVLFSAKESAYKAWFPLSGKWLGFKDALVSFDPGAGIFQVQLLVSGPAVEGREITGFDGRFLLEGGLVLTSAFLPAGGRAHTEKSETATPANLRPYLD